VELVRLVDQDLPRQIGMRELIHMQRTDTVVRDIAVLPRDVQPEREGVEREPLRHHLADGGEQEVDAGAGRPPQTSSTTRVRLPRHDAIDPTTIRKVYDFVLGPSFEPRQAIPSRCMIRASTT
jgi:hypothetical protein